MKQKTIKQIGLIALAALFCSCNLFKIWTSPVQEEVELRFSTENSRTIEPNAATPIESFDLYGSKDGGAETNLAHLENLNNAVLFLEPGLWDFTLCGNNSGNVIVKGSQLEVELADRPVNLIFTLTPLETGLGNLDIELTWPASIPVASIVPTFNGTIEDAIDVTGLQTVHYTNQIERGGYLLFLSLRDSSGQELAIIPEYIKYLPDMISSAVFNLTEEDFNSPPPAPSLLNAATGNDLTTIETGKITLTWTDNSVNESAFEIEYSDDEEVTWQVLDDAVDATSETITKDLTRGTSYHFRIRSKNSFGESEWSNTAAYTVPWLVNFSVDGGTIIKGQELASGELSTEPPIPTKYGCIFAGWFLEDTFTTPSDFGVGITDNTTLYAKWTGAVIFDANTGTGSMATQLWIEGDEHQLPACTITRAGYDFVGWSYLPLGKVEYVDEGLYTMGTSGDTLYARWNNSNAVPGSEFTTQSDGGDGLRIQYYNGDPATYGGHVIIPDMIDGQPVTAIYDSTSTSYGSFYKNTNSRNNLTEITFPETMTRVGNYAFYNCRKLTTLHFTGNGMRIIGEYSFYYTGLNELILPEGITTLENYAFYRCFGTDGVASSDGLTRVECPESLKYILDYAFYYCYDLVEVNIPGVVEIGYGSFLDCESLQSISWGESLTIIGGSSFNECSNLSIESFPESLEVIGSSAFYNCDSITSVDFPNGFNTLESSAFFNCNNLSSITFPDNNITIGTNVFYGCEKITSVDLGNSLTKIPTGMFQGDKGLTDVVLPDSVETIGTSSFESCTNLKTIDTGKALRTIGTDAFTGCAELETITLPDTVETIGDTAFYNCKMLRSINWGKALRTIGESAFRGCSILSTVEMPDTVTSLGPYAFYNCTSLTSVHLSEGLTLIPSRAFSGCYSLGTINMPSGLTSIGTYAFYLCYSLNSINFPNELISIADYSFQGCASLIDVVLPDSVTTLGPGAFEYCRSLTSFELGDGLTEIPSYLFQSSDCLETVIFGENIQSIGANAFFETDISSLTFPDSMRTIGETAFQNCDNLTTCNFNSGITTIGASAFNGCTSLTSLELPEDLSSLGESAFYECDAIKTLTIGDELSSIPESAFSKNRSLETVNISRGVTQINQSAFSHCTKLNSIDLSNIITLSNNVFGYCSSLTEITLGADINSIESNAFIGCTALNKIEIKAMIPPTLESNTAFSGNAPGRKIHVTNMEDNAILEAFQAAPNWNLLADDIIEGDFIPNPDELIVQVYAEAFSGSYDLNTLAFNSSGELFACYYSSDSATRVLGPILEGSNIATTPIYATGGSDHPVLLVFDNDDTLYQASDYDDEIYKVSDGGGILSYWKNPTNLLGGDRDPIWGGIAPANFDGISVNPGDLIVIDRDWTSNPSTNSNIFSFSTTSGSDSLLIQGGPELVNAVSGAFSDTILFIADPDNGLFQMDAECNLTKVSDISSRFVAVHPVSGKVYFGGDNNPVHLYCYDPVENTTEMAGSIGSVSDYSWKTIQFTADGSALLVPDTNRILKITGF